MKKTAKYAMVFTIIATMVFVAWGTVRTIKYVQFEMSCTQYLKRAADANTVELAKDELARAISYVEENNLTEGFVTVFLHQPKNDIGYWYNNMTEAYTELENLPEDATSLEKTNVLMKLRETLTDEKDGETNVTTPAGISIYPNNISYFWWGLISGILCLGLWIYELIYWLKEYY